MQEQFRQKPISVIPANYLNLDAFDRQRVSLPYPIYNDIPLYGQNESAWETVTNGVGSTSTYNQSEPTISLTIGTASGAYVIRQQHHYNSYIPGKSQRVPVTWNFGEGVTDVKCVTRSNVSGSAIDTGISQADWNRDVIDGTGSSRLTADWSKFTIGVIDFQALYAGKQRFSIGIDGQTVLVHEIGNSNILNVPYIGNANLPLRYEVRNTSSSVWVMRVGYFDDNNGMFFEATGTISGNRTLKQLCSSCESEGGAVIQGFGFSASNGATLRTGITTRTPIFAIRQKQTFRNDTTSTAKTNRRKAKLLQGGIYVTGADCFIEIVHNHDPSSVTGTWSDVHMNSSSCEKSTDITAITAAAAHVIFSDYVTTSQGNKGLAHDISFDIDDYHLVIANEYSGLISETFVVYVTSLGGAASAGVALRWIEYD